MKNKKRIAAAAAMLLVSALTLSTASYAWFSMNTEVTATDLQVTAKAPNSLLISTESATTGFGSTVALVKPEGMATEIMPSHPNTLQMFARLTNKGMKNVDQAGVDSGATKTAVNDFIAGSTAAPTGEGAANSMIEATTTDYFADQIWLKYDGKAGETPIYVKADFTSKKKKTEEGVVDSEDLITKAMHVLIADASNNVVADIDMSQEAKYYQLKDVKLTANAEGTPFMVYYYLDGQDKECYNAAITADNTLSVDLSFTTADPGAENMADTTSGLHAE